MVAKGWRNLINVLGELMLDAGSVQESSASFKSLKSRKSAERTRCSLAAAVLLSACVVCVLRGVASSAVVARLDVASVSVEAGPRTRADAASFCPLHPMDRWRRAVVLAAALFAGNFWPTC